MDTATFAGGCFWCIEAVFVELKGVRSVESGYAGGKTKNPSYQSVCRGDTGHAEVVQVEFDPEQISYRNLLEVFFAVHDSTQLNRQGADIGTQYRSAIFYHSDEQRREAEEFAENLRDNGIAVVTEISPIGDYYPAEEYHQKYFDKNPSQPYCLAAIPPKIDKLRSKFTSRGLLKS